MFSAAYFDELFAHNSDPWGFRTRWYEMRKRAILLAALPAPYFSNAFEPGCANAEFSAALATRCERLLASDCSASAIELSKARLRGTPHVVVEQMQVPQQWPSEQFDLIVINELAYYLTATDLLALYRNIKSSLRDNGVLLACHWRHPIDGALLNGDAVHAELNIHLQLPRLLSHNEEDFILEVWSNQKCSAIPSSSIS